jgi:Clr5 domain
MASPSIQWHPTARRAPNAPGVSPTEWEGHHALLKELYINQNKPLKEVMDHMSTNFGFSPSCVHYRPFDYADNDLSAVNEKLTKSSLQQTTVYPAIQALAVLQKYQS